MLNRNSELGKHMTKLAQKLSGIEEEKPQKEAVRIVSVRRDQLIGHQLR